MKKEVRQEESRYIVGIDLGTTNSAVAYIDTASPSVRIESFSIPQFVSPNVIESCRTLPSFLSTYPSNTLLPWEREEDLTSHAERTVAGVYARDYGIKTPATFISSAKSWLCHANVDRTARILPWLGMLSPGTENVKPGRNETRFRYSPVDTSAFYLAHMRHAWNDAFPDYPMEDQDVVLTLPASFDEVARELTIEAARRAGLPKIVLIEEPLAAFYSWMFRYKQRWDEFIRPDDKILVCDVGGGTTDLTLIRVERCEVEDGRSSSESDRIRFHRIAVGDHLILGGDNFDLALAGHLEQRLFAENKIAATADNRLSPRIWGTLVRIACQLKERFLGDNPPETQTIAIPRPGAKLVGGSVSLDVSRTEVEDILINGFLPFVPLESSVMRKKSGLREMGLPYADDPAISRWLARFLSVHRYTGLTQEDTTRLEQTSSSDLARPDIVLFNGGVFESKQIQQRLVEILKLWFSPMEQPWSPVVLANPELDLAVSRGAACYGLARRGKETRVSAALARTYYVGIATRNKSEIDSNSDAEEALCLVPGGAEPGARITLDRTFELTIGTPVRFPIYASSVRLNDRPGEIVTINPEETKSLQPIQTVLKTRSARRLAAGTITASLEAHLTELGTIELALVEVPSAETKGRRGSWKLQFDVRRATQTDVQQLESHAEEKGIFDESIAAPLEELIDRVFGLSSEGELSLKPSQLNREMSQVSDLPRDQWPTTLLRRLGDKLILLDEGRKKSGSHEARWLNLLGFCCRPGFGATMDDWRVDRLWKQVAGNLLHTTPECRIQNWILWRRVASGLSTGQQNTLVEPLISNIRALHRQMIKGLGHGSDLDLASQEGAEIWRLLGAMELLAPELKKELGDMIVDLMDKKRLKPVFDPLCWTLGRLGARVPFHGPVSGILPARHIEPWLESLLKHDDSMPSPIVCFALMQLARKTDQRGFDVSASIRDRVLAHLKKQRNDRFYRLVETRQELEENEESDVFGETLPMGLTLNS